MNVLAVNASPKARNSNTDQILQPFLEGMRNAGAETETLYLKELKMKPCQGCLSCWFKTPGVCAIKDDMAWVLEKIIDCEYLVQATPLYNFTMSAYLKMFMERNLPLVLPHIKIMNGHPGHPSRYPDKKWKWVLISNAGLPEPEHFDVLVENFNRKLRAFGGGESASMVAMILKGQGVLFAATEGSPSKDLFADLAPEPLNFDWYFDACRKAGEEVVREGKISDATKDILDRPLLDVEPEVFFKNGEKFVDAYLEQLEKS
jgi:putative NADPH-quinone reductase